VSDNADWTVIVVGGAGGMGRYSVRNIAKLENIGRLMIADRNVEYAQRLADEVGPPCEVLELDATDEAALRAAFADCDAVCNTMGPFSLFARPIQTAALESGCHYLDIDDDWQSTVEAFELDDLAKDNGVAAIIGIGGSPGFTNLMALLAIEDLDQADAIYTGWSLTGAVTEEEPDYPATAPASAAVEHWLLQCSGTIRIWDGGEHVDAVPVEPLVLDIPGFGEQTVYSMGHPEPITLPQSVPGLRRSMNVQTGPVWLFEHLRNVAADYTAGRVTLAEGAELLTRPPRPERSAKDPNAAPKKYLPHAWSLAQGTRGGEPHSVMVYMTAFPHGQMGGNTGVPLAIGLELLRQGKVTGTGVLSPEAAIDPHDFIELYARFVEPPLERGVDTIEKVASTSVVSAT
jgi:saccharopine dehydrogenase-like NADP-dependent oxidoreductase